MSKEIRATVERYDPSTRRAIAVVEGDKSQTFSFSSTCFYAGQFSREPAQGEKVRIALGDSPTEILGVWAIETSSP